MDLHEVWNNYVFPAVLTIAIIACLFVTGRFFVEVYSTWNKQLDSQKAQMHELFDNQVSIVHELEDLQKDASYEYLKSVSVYLFQVMSEDGQELNGAIGSGTIVADKDGYFYIMTNKHVCNNTTIDKCFVVMGEKREDWYKLDFVKQTESQYDLALWRINKRLIGKRAIKGLNMPTPQQKVYSVGQYLGFKYIYTQGTMAGYEDDFVLYNLPCAPGCSGSGIFNNEGELISVVFAVNTLPVNGLPFAASSLDSSKAIAINGDVVRLFLKDLIDD